MTWEIVLGIIALVGFFITCATPMIKLNTSITRLNETIGTIKDIVERNDAENKQSHSRIYDRLDAHEDAIHAHSERIVTMESASSRKIEQLKELEKETALQGEKIAHIETHIDNLDKQVVRNEQRIDHFHE